MTNDARDIVVIALFRFRSTDGRCLDLSWKLKQGDDLLQKKEKKKKKKKIQRDALILLTTDLERSVCSRSTLSRSEIRSGGVDARILAKRTPRARLSAESLSLALRRKTSSVYPLRFKDKTVFVVAVVKRKNDAHAVLAGVQPVPRMLNAHAAMV